MLYLKRILFGDSKPKEETVKKPKGFAFFSKKPQEAPKVVYNTNKTTQSAFSTLKNKLQNISPLDKKARLANQERSLYSYFVKNINDGFNNSPLKDIAAVVNHCKRRVEEGEISDLERKDFIALFNELGKLPKEKFDAKFFLAGQEKLQRILAPELDKLMKTQEAKPTLVDDKDHQLELAIAQAELAIRMGAGTEQAGGCNGAVIVKNLEGKAIGVFKAPPDQENWDLSRTLKSYFGQARLFNRTEPMNEAYSEVAMYYFSEVFGFDLAPAAKTVEIKNKEGAFLAFLGGYKELADVRVELDAKTSYSNDELVKWQLAMVAIFASLNFDPHDENIFVKMQDGNLTSLKVIDAGNNFAKALPGEWGTKGHRSEPGDLKISGEKFLPEVLKFIETNLTEARYAEFVRKVSVDRPGFWTPEMDLLHRETLEVLRNGVLSGAIATPRDLLNILTQEKYDKHISTKPLNAGNPMTDSILFEVGDENVDLLRSWCEM